jgi:hypothetical protein
MKYIIQYTDSDTGLLDERTIKCFISKKQPFETEKKIVAVWKIREREYSFDEFVKCLNFIKKVGLV